MEYDFSVKKIEIKASAETRQHAADVDRNWLALPPYEDSRKLSFNARDQQER